ncbi:MAG: isoprenoid biosynthesis glyoxalase ElbB [Planctomycetes bacterium]|nr:isoprenoid biosynthesis glyoxalase ElbB [Planctomycetota bacterium]MCB9885597.1 isoprenoid biosynthesis glyoxalase ElbB [Planctomycetota bacterium]
MSKRVGVILSGCGFLDGSEVHEAVLALMHLDRHGVEIVCMAPDGNQADVVDHVAKKPVEGASRSMLTEAARIARGRIQPLGEVDPATLDAVVMPGGFGAAKNLSNFAVRGAAGSANPEVARVLKTMHAAGKPIGAICIAPAVVALVLGKEHPRLTIGNDAGTAKAIEQLGAAHVDCAVTDCVIDADRRIVTTPAYMYDARVHEVAQGIGKLVDAVVGMMGAAS